MIQATWVNNKKKPLDDPRVRRAMHLVLDKSVLVDVVKDVAPMMVGGFIYPFSEFATPKENSCKRLGYQEDPAAAIKEARALMAAAGHATASRDWISWCATSRASNFGRKPFRRCCKRRSTSSATCAPLSNWCGSTTSRAGNYDLAIGAIVSTLLDPSDYFNAWYGKDGPQNYSFWDNKEFQALSDQIDREVDAAKRLALIRQAEAIMEQDPPLLPIAWEKINDSGTTT